nr:hypothetical protein [Muribaculum sp. NM65_B17]
MNTVLLHEAYDFGDRVPDAAVINPVISNPAAISQRLKRSLANSEIIADFIRSHQVRCFLSAQAISQNENHVAEKFMLVEDTVEGILLN